MASTIPSEKEMRDQATSLYNPAYQNTINLLKQQAENRTTLYNRSLEDYGKTVDKLLKDTQQSLADSLVKRGMSRSDRGTFEITKGLADVNAAAQEDYARLQQDYNTDIANIESNKSTAVATFDQNVTAELYKIMQFYEGVRQFNEQQALREKELAYQMSRGSGGGSSKSSAKTAADVYAAAASPAQYIPSLGSGYKSTGYYVAPKTTTKKTTGSALFGSVAPKNYK